MGLEIGQAELSLEDRIEFWRTLSGWLTSGGGRMPVHECIRNTCEVFSRDEFATFQARMDRIVREFMTGEVKFHAALRLANVGFTNQELAIVKAAEDSNQLRDAVPALVEALTMSFNAKRSLKRQLIPLLGGGFMLLLMSLGVIVFMLPTVLTPVIERSPDALAKFPFVIIWYWNASLFLRGYPLVPVIACAIPIVIFFLRNTAFLKPKIEKVLLWFTPTRRLILAYNGVMIVYFMPALVRSYMPMPEVLRALSGSLENLHISNALRVAALAHENGERVGSALQGLPIRGSFRSAVEAGEKTGAIADRVDELKTPFANEFDRISRKVAAAIKLIVMALLLPFFIMSMYTSLVAPIFALMEF